MNYVDLFNAQLNNQPVDLKDLLQLVEDYLIDTNKPTDILQVFSNNPQLISFIYPGIRDYFCRKHTICSVLYDNKILMYYATN